VNWYEAYGFCIWDGGFLPTEAEWVYAAAGGSQQREHPWGSTDPGLASQYAILNCEYPSPIGATCGLVNIAPVGTPTLGAGLWGQLDLVGEMTQWTLDWYETAYGSGRYVDGPCTDCAYLTAICASGCSQAFPSYRAIHGCSFYEPITNCDPSTRGTSGPSDREGFIGFRCARGL
jgi:formylglycine-generating enzyme required for sulfatase activity